MLIEDRSARVLDAELSYDLDSHYFEGKRLPFANEVFPPKMVFPRISNIGSENQAVFIQSDFINLELMPNEPADFRILFVLSEIYAAEYSANIFDYEFCHDDLYMKLNLRVKYECAKQDYWSKKNAVWVLPMPDHLWSSCRLQSIKDL